MNQLIEFLDGYLLILDGLLLLGIVFFILLSKSKGANKLHWLLFFVLVLTVLYENFGGYLIYNHSLNASVNAFLGNTQNPKYNLWLYNSTATTLVPSCYLLAFKYYAPPSRKRLNLLFLALFLGTVFLFQVFELEPIYGAQPIIYSLGSGLVLISCSLFFINLMNDPGYLEVNPLRLLSFWQVITLFFSYSITFLITISFEYLYRTNPVLAGSIVKINIGMSVLTLVIIVLILGTPVLNLNFEEEPTHV